jgi:hypothetical protein
MRLCDPSQNGRFSLAPHRHNETAGLPVRSHCLPSASVNKIWPSTRSGPLGRTVIFTASSDIVDTLSLAKDVLRIAKFTLFLSRSSNPLRQSPPTRSLATLNDCHPERTTMSKDSRQRSLSPVSPSQNTQDEITPRRLPSHRHSTSPNSRPALPNA